MEQQSELRAALEEIRKNMVEYLEYNHIRAELCREYYLALIDQGFEKSEALQLCQYFRMTEN